MPESDGTAGAIVEHRLRVALRVAGEVRTGVSVDDLSDLMPRGGPEGAGEVTEYLRRNPPLGTVVGGLAIPPGSVGLLPSTSERRERGLRYLAAANDLVGSRLALVRPLLACTAVTGSTAYGEPEAGDDCDVFAVTRPGAMWAFLTFLYLRLRFDRRSAAPDDPSEWCFNYVLEAPAAVEAFSKPQGFLFAREALSARPIQGERYYRRLLASAPWLKDEAPRLYARWEDGSAPPPTSGAEPAPLPVRLVNAVLYPVIASYLQVVGLFRNHRLRRQGREAECFRTVTLPARLKVLSRRYSRLSEVYAPASIVAAVSSDA